MQAQPQNPQPRQAFFNPGGFSLHQGVKVSEIDRLQNLISVFFRLLLKGWVAKVRIASFMLPAIGWGIWVFLHGGVTVIPLEIAEQPQFLFDNISRPMAANLGWLMLAHAFSVTPLIARDAQQGALLLYFSRPVSREQYLIARIASVSALSWLELAVPALVLLAVHFVTYSGHLGNSSLSPILLWPLLTVTLLLSTLVSAICLSLASLCCGVIARSPSAAPLFFGGAILGSIALAKVLQMSYSQDSFAAALSLAHAFRGFTSLALMPAVSHDVPHFAVIDALTGAAIWLSLAFLAWNLLQRFMANPPLGKGRAA